MQAGTAVVVAVLVALLTLLVSGGARGDDAQRCATFSVQSQVRERLVTGHGQRVVVIGDSYSVGLGLRDPERSWPSRLPGRVHVHGFSGSGFSAGASGCRRVAYDVRAPRALRGGTARVVVQGGLNDYDQPAGDVRRGFRTLMRELAGRDVLVVGPPEAPARARAAVRVDAILAQESDRAGVRYLSMLGHRFAYLEDRLHLTPAGHRAFGAVVATSVER